MATDLTPPLAGLNRSLRGTGLRCPHLVFQGIFGQAVVDGLLDYVAAKECDFEPVVVADRHTGRRRVDPRSRDAVTLNRPGPFGDAFATTINKIAPEAIRRLGLRESRFDAREFGIYAYRDGGHFAPHIDTVARRGKVRILSCVYYFAKSPRPFSNGELRLHGFPLPGNAPAPIVDIVAETDSLVIFPSWMRHEVLPVAVPSATWLDSRFTLNCWIHRRDAADDATSGS